ncbi:unnamed protein product [Mytilus edulis]|uniref:Uncharacterized protein n=1 Tax=Mytilus edulis TaxID=6550 RepID=A0A8S3TT50_MYTED|nr:unnamed protein product [Mytilus edulis]
MALYHYLCLSITGIEEHIKTTQNDERRQRSHIDDNKETIITSGSFGEGLEMRGSDLDIMEVMKSIEVCEDANILPKADKISFTMEMEDTHPGYTKLRLVHSKYQDISILCIKIDSDFYFSNILIKRRFTTDILSTVHGPCLSDKYGLYDVAYCLHSKYG